MTGRLFLDISETKAVPVLGRYSARCPAFHTRFGKNPSTVALFNPFGFFFPDLMHWLFSFLVMTAALHSLSEEKHQHEQHYLATAVKACAPSGSSPERREIFEFVVEDSSWLCCRTVYTLAESLVEPPCFTMTTCCRVAVLSYHRKNDLVLCENWSQYSIGIWQSDAITALGHLQRCQILNMASSRNDPWCLFRTVAGMSYRGCPLVIPGQRNCHIPVIRGCPQEIYRCCLCWLRSRGSSHKKQST